MVLMKMILAIVAVLVAREAVEVLVREACK